MEKDRLNVLSKEAYDGTLVLDVLPPTEYKYLARVAEVGRKLRANAMTQVQAATVLAAYHDEYQSERAIQDECETANKRWCDAIRMTDSIRVYINGSDDPAFVAAAACHALYEITRDTMMERKSELMAAKIKREEDDNAAE